MNKENLRKYMQSIISISDDKVVELTAYFEYLSLPKHSFLITGNKIIKQTYF
jgi:hypothetical protein